MSLNNVGPGKSLPDDVNVIVEIPRYGDPIKYEVDKDTGAMFVEVLLFAVAQLVFLRWTTKPVAMLRF